VKPIAHVFAAEGPIAGRLSRYERRDGQVRLAQAVEDVMDGGGVLLGEAGTGTGKTLAYLAPALRSGLRVVVSTGTKNLQEQIFFRDLAFLKEALGAEVRCACLKGQENYLCLTRLHSFLHSPKCLAFPSKEVARLEQWAQITTTGDRMELPGLSDDAPIWREVASTKETRIGQKCPNYENCFITKARRDAAVADLVVVNHHLYFADIATRRRGGAVLPGHDVVIFDEAHLIEDIATEFFSTRVSSARVARVIEDSLAAVGAARFAEDPQEENRKKAAASLNTLCANLFDRFRGDQPGRRDLGEVPIDDNAQRAFFRLDSALESFELSLRAREGRDEGVDHCAARIADIRTDLADVLDHRDPANVYWVETKPRSVVLGASPIDISAYFHDEVLTVRDSVVLCSATLSTGGDFRFLKSRLGIDFDVEELVVEAPFDYRRQSRVYLPAAMPDPRSDGFLDAARTEIDRLVHLTGGGALILCTSYRNMHAIHEALTASWPGPVLRQGEAPKSSLISEFRNERDGVLVATAAFWQGVDIPGDDLRLVIIDKLPFAAPGDPVTAARIDHMTRAGGNAFRDYQVPRAALMLKQGFGRLIRTTHDRGIVAILDARLRTKGYGASFLKTLPPAEVTVDFEQLKQWWEEP